MQFSPARAKLWIGSLDNPQLKIRAQYNPKELQIDKQIPWQPHKTRDNRSGDKRHEESEQSDLEFNGGTTRSMTIELLFDSYERKNESVEPDVRTLEELSSVPDPESPHPERRRPHHCIVVWGQTGAGMRPFLCVIESLTTKYTMWNHAGTPVRAVCTVKVKEAHKMAGAQKPRDRYEEEHRSRR